MGSEWNEIRLGKVCLKIGSGATPRGGKDSYRGGSTVLIRSQNVYNNRFTHDGLVYINDSQAHELRNVVVEKNDVLLNITGDSVARCCQVDPSILPARVNQHVAIIRPEPTTLDARFLRYVLVSPSMQDRLLVLASAGATRNALTKSMLETLNIQAPSIKEQQVIAHILGTLDDKIELNRKMNETLEAMARAMFKAWFVDFEPVRAKMEGRWKRGDSLPGLPEHLYELFPDRLVDSELGEIPEGWEVSTLSKYALLNPESWTRNTRPHRIRYVDLSNTKWGRIDIITEYNSEDAPSRAQRVLHSCDTIIGTVRPGNGSYAMITSEGLTGSSGFAVLRPVSPHYSEFIYLAVTTPQNIKRLSNLADGGAYPAVHSGTVIATQLPDAGDSLIHTFSSLVSPLFNNMSANELESSHLSLVRDNLLPKLISGELAVGEAGTHFEVCQ